METPTNTVITVETTVNAPVEKVWKYWNEPDHITRWYFASEDWQAPRAENDLREGGKLKIRMEAKDGSMGFDFEGTYSNVKQNEVIEYALEDGRKVKIVFKSNGNGTTVTESFDADSSHPAEMQKAGWQAILDNFKKHVESAE